jgi:hypothetical protein
MRRLHDGRDCDIALAHSRQHPHAVEIGHHQVENNEIDRRTIAGHETRQCGLARIRSFDVIPKSSGHRLEHAALDGIVINNEYESGHHRSEGGLSGLRIAPPCDITVNAMLMPSRGDTLSPQKRRFIGA